MWSEVALNDILGEIEFKACPLDGFQFLDILCPIFPFPYLIYFDEQSLYSNDILGEIEFKACPLDGRWFEIDDHRDLIEAEKLFADV